MFNVVFDNDISAEVLKSRSEGCARLGVSVENEFQPWPYRQQSKSSFPQKHLKLSILRSTLTVQK